MHPPAAEDRHLPRARHDRRRRERSAQHRYQGRAGLWSGYFGSLRSCRPVAAEQSLTDMLRAMGDLILLRHGETEWSKAGKHTGRTDIPLTPRGEAAAAALAPVLARRNIVAAFSSPAQRAVRTAELAGLTNVKQDPDLWEWDYGGYEGLTTPQIQEQRPGWYLWRDGVIPGDAAHPGETVQQVGERVDRVLARVEPLMSDGNVAL